MTAHPLNGLDCWLELRAAPAAGRRALFLDRDGCVVEETQYLHRPEDMIVLPGAAATIRRARALGYLVGLVTNQAGIGRGYYDWDGFARVQQALDDALAQEGAALDFIAACPFHAEAAHEHWRHPSHPWRKPNPGMLLAVAEALGVDSAASIMVGDTAGDMGAGRAAGVGRLAHVATGHGARERAAVRACADVELLDRLGDLSLD